MPYGTMPLTVWPGSAAEIPATGNFNNLQSFGVRGGTLSGFNVFVFSMFYYVFYVVM